MLKNDTGFVRLPDSELQIMQLIWEMENNGAKDIHAGAIITTYPDVIGHLALTTVLTLITRLHKKGFISIEKRGRINYSRSIIKEDEYKLNAAESFVSTVFKNDKKAFISALYDKGIITERDVAQLVN